MANTTIPIELSSTPGIVDNSNATAITIDSSENVGIGTSSPLGPFHVETAGNSVAYFKSTTANSNIVFIDGSATANVTVGSVDNGQFRIQVNNAERMRIDSSGNVGIGTSSPQQKLHISSSMLIEGGSTDSRTINFTNASGSTGWSIGNGIIDSTHNFRIYDNTAGAARFTVDGTGNVGIGTASPDTTPSTKLHIREDDAVDYKSRAVIQANDQRLVAGSHYQVGVAAYSYLQATNNAETVPNNILLNPDGGNVLVGKTANDDFTVVGTQIDADGFIAVTRNGSIAAVFNRGTNDGEIIQLRKNNSTVGSIGTFGGVSYYAGNTHGFLINGNQIEPSNNNGGRLNNTVDIGSSTYRFKNLYLAGGMQLSRSVTSETEIESYNNTNAGGAKYKISFKQNGTQVGVIEVGTSSTSYLTSSDYRLKENVVAISDATERLKQLKPLRFNFIADADTTVDGFLAHEVQDIVPEAISGVKDEMQEEEYEVTPAVLDEDGNVVTEAVMGTREVPKYQGIDQAKLVPLLTKALQEQQTIIESLEARITALES